MANKEKMNKRNEGGDGGRGHQVPSRLGEYQNIERVWFTNDFIRYGKLLKPGSIPRRLVVAAFSFCKGKTGPSCKGFSWSPLVFDLSKGEGVTPRSVPAICRRRPPN